MSDIETNWREEIATAIKRAYGLGQLYWQQADSESYRENAKSDKTRATFQELLAQSDATIATKDAEIARLKDGERKYAAALTKDQGGIDWRKWMLVPVTECEFIPKAKHDAEIAVLRSALKSAAAFLTWCLEETPIGKPPEISTDVLAKCRAALAQVAEAR